MPSAPGIANVDHSSQVFILFERLPVQKNIFFSLTLFSGTAFLMVSRAAPNAIWNNPVDFLKLGRKQANVTTWEQFYKEVRLLKYYQEENGYFFSCFFVRKLVIGFQII